MKDLVTRLSAALSGLYEIESELGRGGMAVVFRARDLRHDRLVALKVLPPHLASAVSHERFLKEIRLAAGLAHPYIVPVLDSGQADGLLYYVMPIVEGETLRDRLARDGRLPVAAARKIIIEIAEALAAAHAAGVLHRDVKPSNILLTRDHALLADFGVARGVLREKDEALTGTGVLVGTPAYMSPQQALSGEHLDERADQYALGCVAYEMLTGHRPFDGPSPEAILMRHATEPLPPIRHARPEVPTGLADAVERALAKNPADRFSSIEEWVEAMEDGGAKRTPGRPWNRAAGILLLGFGAVGVAWGMSTLLLGSSDETTSALDTRQRVAVLPCVVGPQLERSADSLVGANLAFDIGLWLADAGIPTVPYERTMHRPSPGKSDLPALADSLSARGVVGCAVSPSDTAFHLTAHLWLDSTFAQDLEDEVPRGEGPGEVVAKRLAATLATRITGVASALRGHAAYPGTDNSLAFSDFRQGYRAFYSNRFDEAEKWLASAYERDPDFVEALWLFIDTRRWSLKPTAGEEIASLMGEGNGLREVYEARRGELDPRSRLLLDAVTAPKKESFGLFERALRQLPDDAYAHLLYGDELLHRGALFGYHLDRAIVVLSEAVRLNPRFAPAWSHLAIGLMRQRKGDSARAAVEGLRDASSTEEGLTGAALWQHAWNEYFDSTTAAQMRPHLHDRTDLGLLARMAIAYFDLPDLALELGTELSASSPRGGEAWHTGRNAEALAYASLGQPAVTLELLRGAAAELSGHDREAALAVSLLWDVVPGALGLEGFPPPSPPAVAGLDSLARAARDPLVRARASWGLALAAPSDSAFDRHMRELERVTGKYGLGAAMLTHLAAEAEARGERWREALDRSADLVAYDSMAILTRPFHRAALYLQRGQWYAQLARHQADEAFADSALAAWYWHENIDIDGAPGRRIQAGEIDDALATQARLLSLRLADEFGLRAVACSEAAVVLRRWTPVTTAEYRAAIEAAQAVRERHRCPDLREPLARAAAT